MIRQKIMRRLGRIACRRTMHLPSKSFIVSFTFDDVPASACTIAADMIASAGGQATYYVSGGFERQTGTSGDFFTAQHLHDLVRAGHEIGCHGFSHLNYQDIEKSEVEADIERNRAFFAELNVPIPKNFAYPYGCFSPSVKKICENYFESCRGVQAKINSNTIDLNLLGAFALYSSVFSVESINALLDRYMKTGGWLIFFTHGIEDAPGQFDVSPILLKHTIAGVIERGVTILKISEALKHLSSDA